ncbi:transglutaminase family protein [uncultured Sphingomonas sp.]|uniref:transglutaminase-like domain-containing protein n=1 Tax=uncultured Sphingomonas sp. TaxID=158754 RepID=UPI0025E2409C|nr:transglutaminase family protein [uncultured Sphingomonas sp.]
MRLSIEAVLDYGFPAPADVLLQIEVAAQGDQLLEAQLLTIESDHPIRAVAGEEGIGQRCWARAEHRLVARYAATVSIDRPLVRIDDLPATPAARLPAAAIQYLFPSRYCESDRFENFVRRTFAGLSGGALAVALVDWVRTNVEYAPAPPGGGALHTFAERRGVCRDYAHLLVALARAAEIPALCVSVYAPGVDPPDFHAVAELWLDGAWHLLDATGMARADEMARVGVGRDATDIAFMTIFGTADLWEQRVRVLRLDQERAPPSGVVM